MAEIPPDYSDHILFLRSLMVHFSNLVVKARHLIVVYSKMDTMAREALAIHFHRCFSISAILKSPSPTNPTIARAIR